MILRKLETLTPCLYRQESSCHQRLRYLLILGLGVVKSKARNKLAWLLLPQVPTLRIHHTDLADLFHRVANHDLVVHHHEARAVSVSMIGGCVLIILKFLTSLSPNTWRYVHSLAG